MHVLHKASAIAIVASLYWLVAGTSTNPSAEILVQLGHTSKVTAVIFSPDGKTLALAGSDKAIKLWAWRSGNLLCTLPNQIETVPTIALSSDGKILGSTSKDNSIKQLDISRLAPDSDPSGNLSCAFPLTTFSGHTDSVTAMTFRPDGQSFISTSRDNTLKIWDTSSGAFSEFPPQNLRGATAVAFSSQRLLEKLSIPCSRGRRSMTFLIGGCGRPSFAALLQYATPWSSESWTGGAFMVITAAIPGGCQNPVTTWTFRL